MALTEIKIKNAKPQAKPIRLFDGDGLYLEVAPKGGKWWRLKYRFNGKEKRLSLGVYPATSLKEARENCYEARKLLSNGIDPSENRKAKKAAKKQLLANSFEAITREWLTKQSKAWSPSHIKRITSCFERDIFPWLGNRPIASITAPEILTVIQRIEKRGALESAHRTLSSCGQVFRYAIATGRTGHDLSTDLRGSLSPVKNGHFAAVTEPQQAAELLRMIDDTAAV